MTKLPIFPRMQCDKGCGDCCGPAPATEHEYKKAIHVAKAKKLVLKHQGLTCPFYQEGTCAIYDARPLACRLYGHLKDMQCSRGYNTNISDDAGRKAILKNGFPTRILHEVLVEFGIVATLDDALTPSAEDMEPRG